MILELAQILFDQISGLNNLVRYVTVRSTAAALTALILSIFLMPVLIRVLQSRQWSQPIRDDGPSSHHDKSGTPTMGGIIIVLSISLSVLLWANISSVYIWLCLISLWAFAGIGLADDVLKLRRRSPKGLGTKVKFGLQIISALCIAVALYALATEPQHTQIIVPFFKDLMFHPGVWGFVLFSTLVLVGSSNAVNLTDGLDGLAILPTVFIGASLGAFAYVAGHAGFSSYLSVPNIKGASELVVVVSALIGAGLGFLWFNSYPAQVFMGDVGSLSIGALLAIIAILVRQELAFFIMAGIYVIETLSVMIQVASYKWLGRRVFKMAPLHHHYEALGVAEPKIVVRFWTLSWAFAVLGLLTLKIR